MDRPSFASTARKPKEVPVRPIKVRPVHYQGYASEAEAQAVVDDRYGENSYVAWELVRYVQFVDGRWGVERWVDFDVFEDEWAYSFEAQGFSRYI